MGEQKPRLIRSPEDAELAARDWLRAHGFSDAEVTPKGPDSGVDVVSREVVVQVKAEMVPTGRPVLQAISGIATHAGKRAALFTLAGATVQAMEFAADAGVAVFRFDLQGLAKPQNAAAHELATLHAGTSGRPGIVLGEVGRLLVDHIEGQRHLRRNLVVAGFAPDTNPLSGFREGEPVDEFGLPHSTLTHPLPDPHEPRFDRLQGGAISMNVTWVDPSPPAPPQPVVPPAQSAFDPTVEWEPEYLDVMVDRDVWHFPMIRISTGIGDEGGREHQELHYRLSNAKWRWSRILAYGGTDGGDYGDYFDLRKPNTVAGAVGYVEARLRNVGSSIERLHWWAFQRSPSSVGENTFDFGIEYGSVFIASESQLSDVVAAVDAARLWPRGEIEAPVPQPPDTWVVRVPTNLAPQATDTASDLLSQLEALGVHIEPQ